MRQALHRFRHGVSPRWLIATRRILTIGAVAASVAAVSFALPAPGQAPGKDISTITVNGVMVRDLRGPNAEADRALVEMLEQNRDAKTGEVIKHAGFTFTITEAAAQSMDTGCDVSSSNPGGYDGCAITNNNGSSVMHAYAPGFDFSGWAGIQERDSDEHWRAWGKGQSRHDGSLISTCVNPKRFRAWADQSGGGSWVQLGESDPTERCDFNAQPVYFTGATWRAKAAGNARNGVTWVKDSHEMNTPDQGWVTDTDDRTACSHAMDWGVGSPPSASLCSAA
jgi:hypothetical protein